MQCLSLCFLVSAWLTGHNYEPPQREAMLRNIYLESRFQPCVTRGKNGSAYLFQWLGPRRRAIETLQRGCPSWETQLRFATFELRNDKKYNRFWQTKNPTIAFYELRERFGRGK